MAYQAALSTARNSLNEMFGNRLPVLVNSETVASVIQIMEQEAGRRFKNAEWFQEVTKSSGEALLRELVHISAYNNWMEYQRYRQNERIETLLAVSLAQQVTQIRTMNEQMETLTGG